MKLILSIVSILLCSVQVAATAITAYVCDTCGEQGAQVLAGSYAPAEQCHFSNPQGTIPTPEDRVCNAPAKDLIVINSVTEQAFKYRVQLQCYGSWCSSNVSLVSLAITNDEQNTLATYYDIDASMRNAIGQMNEMLAMSLRGDFSTLSASSAAQQCSANPMNYFSNPTIREQINSEIRERIKQKVG